ncbi:MAG: hypothetical protein M3Z06_00530 [Actinomycetota bacterium]|nr:hypothetical protein [Actinomycetota bacterium]
MTVEAVVERPEAAGLYLWVLEQNRDAQAFYEAQGRACAGRRMIDAPGGIATRITGLPAALRYTWPQPTELLRRS